MTRHIWRAATVALTALALTGCSAAEPIDLAAALLVPEDFPGDGWELLVSDSEEETDDFGVCAFDLDGVLPDDVIVGKAEASFNNDGIMAFASESVIEVADAEARLAAILADLEGCGGEYEAGVDSVISSDPIPLRVPGAAVSGCRIALVEFTNGILSGPFCFGASGNRMISFTTLTPEPEGGMTQDEVVAVLTTAMARATGA